ncbi:CHAT domain-containing protein [Kitasatospora sp. A2-31]|uniref:CHAT domain-containing protein n=1 Tax=Kitasatospora sp. A2-31 TaxID=2916414 RepID=UPI001EEAF2B7|nr:CHAT domain-containing protein [Kitasatospora sp. A2-31]MCG6494040.1 CHAT domain-containing protein [Kitasatospora sp. A2-31]
MTRDERDERNDGDLKSRISDFVRSVDVEDLILSFDTDFDIPMDQSQAIGVLRLSGAYDGAGASGTTAVARRTGAFWCDLVKADVEYDLLRGLRLIEESRTQAQWLHSRIAQQGAGHGAVLPSYVTARWHDGTGRIRYRTGSYTRARVAFETAVNVAEDSGLWWILPDLRSNFTRARFEEIGQKSATRPSLDEQAELLDEMEELRAQTHREAVTQGIDLERVSPGDATRTREFLRGYSNVLHNLATALRASGYEDESQLVSRQSLGISQALGDAYRTAQSLISLALADPDQAVDLFTAAAAQPWARGRLIARQNLALHKGGREGVEELRQLLDELGSNMPGTGSGRETGMDVDFHAYTVRHYLTVASSLSAEEQPGDVVERELEMARSVRRVVVIPAYKRAYAAQVRPVYLRHIARAMNESPSRQRIEEVFSLVEESTARELLDLMSNASLPLLGPPQQSSISSPPVSSSPPPALDPGGGADTCTPVSGTRGRRRRSPLRAPTQEKEPIPRDILEARSQEFEEQFLRYPLEFAPHDAEIAHRLMMYTGNNPGTCVVRYFTYGSSGHRSAGLGALISRDGSLDMISDMSRADLRDLAQGICEAAIEGPPSRQDCHDMWTQLLQPVWGLITRGGTPSHLILVPTDEIFALPLHMALPRSGAFPLGAMLPLSHSVSVTAFVGQGRHLLKRQPVAADDDLAALLVTDGIVTGNEVASADWPAPYLHIAGTPPTGLTGPFQSYPADWSGIKALVACKPEFFVYAGHGYFSSALQELGPALKLASGDYLTQYDIALRLRLPRNKLSILGACLAGQGMQSGGGDVLGFMRSLIASGSGVIGVPLWSVCDDAIADTVGYLLRTSRITARSAGAKVFDAVEALYLRYRGSVEDAEAFGEWQESLPIALYL